MTAGNTNTAERAYAAQSLSLDENVLETMQGMAVRYYRHGMHAESESLLTFLMRHLPGRPQIYYEMGKAKHAQSEYAAALTNYQRAVTLGLPDPEVYLYMGQCCIFLNYFEQADKALRRFLSLGRMAPSVGSIPLLVRAEHLLTDLVVPRLQKKLQGASS
jgi:tetratricopeptide (TPR) repeat protein